MNAPIAAVLLLSALGNAGTWKINNWVPGDDVQLSISRRDGSSRWQMSTGYPLSELKGLTREQLRAMHGEVSFRLERDAGTLVFEGKTTVGVGSGDFRFEPNPAFREKLVGLGYPSPDDEGLLGMAMRDVSLDYASQVGQLGFKKLEVDDLFAFRDRGIDLEMLRDVAAIGYAGLAASDVVLMSDHGVRGKYMKGMKDSGYRMLKVDEVVRLHDRGISPEFVRGLVEAGRASIEFDDIILLHDHGITPQYVAKVVASGFKDLTTEQIVRLHDNGID
jgi:hypothetical protein